ncbi:MAG: hypothetical protein JWM21_4728 [Acidobacteria bacterium]|nr:hypothetical protein [Acidobacteriota bacterium]
MKQSENNEIDSLLRGFPRRKQSVFANSPGNPTGAHLDADELNSYAEGALPAATRARYTSHLADCDDCRKIVTQLSLAAGLVINETPISKTATAFDWRRMLAALFAPAMLRYVLPAMLLVVIGIVFFGSRRQSRESLIALNTKSSPAQADGAPTKEQTDSIDKLAESGKPAAPSATRGRESADKTGEKAAKTGNPAKPESAVSSNAKESPKNEVAALAQPTYAPEPAPPPATAKQVNTSEKDSSRVVGGMAELKPSVARKRADDKRGDDAKDAGSASGAPAADAPAKEDERKKAKTVNGARGGFLLDRDEQAEVRAVGGRRFQRHNNIWVDVAYKPSFSMTTVARGSEQYRALVADEPVIDTIAKQLSGEIILIWKGRAYRIR